MMTNLQIAEKFERIASLLEIKGELIFKINAYRNAAENLRTLTEDLHKIKQEQRLEQIPGVGKAIAAKIDELLSTGQLEFLQRLEQEVPPSLIDLLKVPDVGPKRATIFWKQAGVTTLDELRRAARDGNLRHLPGMGERMEIHILNNIEAYQRNQELAGIFEKERRVLLGYMAPAAQRWMNWLKVHPAVQRVEIAGSLRRWCSTVGDLDLVVATGQVEKLLDDFVHHTEKALLVKRKENRATIETHNGLKIQLWAQSPERFGNLWQYATGSRAHIKRLRLLAQQQGTTLMENGMAHHEQEMLFASEEEVYAALGLPWIAPELREDNGEIEAALVGKLPNLVEISDLQSDLHVHSTWSDGQSSIAALAAEAKKRGLKTLAITDHSISFSPEDLRQQRVEIDAVQKEMGDTLRILQGAEVEILANGRLDYNDEVLASLDIVVASLHFCLTQPRPVITERLLNAIRNPHVDIIAHPSGRVLPQRYGADLDWQTVLDAAAQSGVALEINSNPARLDLDEIYVRQAKRLNIPIAINTDAHAVEHFDQIHYGISVARRAGLEAANVLSTWSQERLLAWLAARPS